MSIARDVASFLRKINYNKKTRQTEFSDQIKIGDIENKQIKQ